MPSPDDLDSGPSSLTPSLTFAPSGVRNEEEEVEEEASSMNVIAVTSAAQAMMAAAQNPLPQPEATSTNAAEKEMEDFLPTSTAMPNDAEEEEEEEEMIRGGGVGAMGKSSRDSYESFYRGTPISLNPRLPSFRKF